MPCGLQGTEQPGLGGEVGQVDVAVTCISLGSPELHADGPKPALVNADGPLGCVR